jgi:hypothetical protein
MRVFTFRWKIAGAHTHIRVFVGPPDVTPALCGELVMTNEEFAALRQQLAGSFPKQRLKRAAVFHFHQDGIDS